MILSTVPDMVIVGCSGIRAVSRFSSVILADLAMRGFAISFLTLARVALPDSFLRFVRRIFSTRKSVTKSRRIVEQALGV